MKGHFDSILSIVYPCTIGIDWIEVSVLVRAFEAQVDARRIYSFIHIMAGFGLFERVSKQIYRYAGPSGMSKRSIGEDYCVMSRVANEVLCQLEKRGGFICIKPLCRRDYDAVTVLRCLGYVKKTAPRTYYATEMFWKHYRGVV